MARGKKLATFTGSAIRPTPDRVREAIFSSLFSRLGTWQGKRVLDLFAGSGAMGLEALSRGAKECIFVDQGSQSAQIVPANLRSCGLERQARLIRMDVLAALPQLSGKESFDVIFLDPPYGKGLVNQTLNALSDLKLLAPDGIICAEAAKSDEVSDQAGDLCKINSRHYGSTSVYFFSCPQA